MNLRIISPNRTIKEIDNAQSVTFQTPDGQNQVLSGHKPLITLISEGQIKIRTVDETHESSVFVFEGIAKIDLDKILIIVEDFSMPDELVEEEIKKAIQRAEEQISDSDLNPAELIRLEKVLRYEKFKLREIAGI